MEIVVHSKNYLFQETFQKNMNRFDRNSQLRSVMQKGPVELPESESDKKSDTDSC